MATRAILSWLYTVGARGTWEGAGAHKGGAHGVACDPTRGLGEYISWDGMANNTDTVTKRSNYLIGFKIKQNLQIL